MKDIENVCLEVDELDFDNYSPISPDIVLTSSFKFKNFDHYVKVNAKEEFAYTYTRDGNPTLNLLETKLARLEKGEAARSNVRLRNGRYFSINFNLSKSW